MGAKPKLGTKGRLEKSLQFRVFSSGELFKNCEVEVLERMNAHSNDEH